MVGEIGSYVSFYNAASLYLMSNEIDVIDATQLLYL